MEIRFFHPLYIAALMVLSAAKTLATPGNDHNPGSNHSGHIPNVQRDQALCPNDPIPGGSAISLDGRGLSYGAEFDGHLGNPTDDVGQLINLRECRHLGVKATGFTTQSPAFAFDLDHMVQENGSVLNVTFSTRIDCDAVLLISNPDGHWAFADDAQGFEDAAVTFSGAHSGNGTYKVWMGSYDPVPCHGQLLIMTDAIPTAQNGTSVEKEDFEKFATYVQRFGELLDNFQIGLDQFFNLAERFNHLAQDMSATTGLLQEKTSLLSNVVQQLEPLPQAFKDQLHALNSEITHFAMLNEDYQSQITKQYELNNTYYEYNKQNDRLNDRLESLIVEIEDLLPSVHKGCVVPPVQPALLATTGRFLTDQIWIYAEAGLGQQVHMSDCAAELPPIAKPI